MYRLAAILLILAGSGLLAGSMTSVNESDASQLAERVRVHINAQMYDTCKSVVLNRVADAVYRGQAEFLNGITANLEASLSGGAIEYHFLPRAEFSSTASERRLFELEVMVAQQKAEIARLRELCLRAGIEAEPPRLQPTSTGSEDANGVKSEPNQLLPASIDREANGEPVSEEYPRFTWRVYEQIQKNMSYAEVAYILDDGGDLISGSYFDNAQNEVIVWTNPDDSHICIVFRDGLVLVKTQFGLPESRPGPLP